MGAAGREVTWRLLMASNARAQLPAVAHGLRSIGGLLRIYISACVEAL